MREGDRQEWHVSLGHNSTNWRVVAERVGEGFDAYRQWMTWRVTFTPVVDETLSGTGTICWTVETEYHTPTPQTAIKAIIGHLAELGMFGEIKELDDPEAHWKDVAEAMGEFWKGGPIGGSESAAGPV